MMKEISILSPGTGNEARVVDDGGVLFLIFKKSGEKRPCSKETCAEFGYPETPAQVAARTAHTRAFLAEYRAAQARRTPEELAEEATEIRAAFGPGQTIVNVVTGQITKT